MASYKVIVIDTSVAFTARPIDGAQGSGFRGSRIDYITVLQVPVGANVALIIGENANAIPLTDPIPFDICPPEETGVYFSVLTAGAGNVVLLVSFADGSVQGGTVP